MHPANEEQQQFPKSRFGHTAVVNNKSMYVFGGWDGNDTLNDISVYNV
jgi:hypothetical protein